jgi:hypothetical protein
LNEILNDIIQDCEQNHQEEGEGDLFHVTSPEAGRGELERKGDYENFRIGFVKKDERK